MMFCFECRSITNRVHDHRNGYGLDDGPGLATKQMEVKARRHTARKLREAGLKQETIADLLQVSRPTIVADLKAYQKTEAAA